MPPMRSRCALLAFCLAVTASSAGAVTLETRVSASTGDAEENAATGLVNITSSDLELVRDGSNNQVVGIHFPDQAIPGGATITAAWVQFQADASGSEATALTVQGDLTQESPAFTTAPTNVSARPRTSASVAWAPAAWTAGAQGPAQRTPSLVSIVQERVDAGDWVEGNALTLIITGTGRRNAVSWNGGAAAAPLLHVEFELPSNLLPVLSIASPLAGTTALEGDTIAFSATAIDPESGDVSASISWTSDLDGMLAVGPSFSRSDLSVGVHQLTVQVSDGEGGETTRMRQLTIFAPSNKLITVGDIGDCTSDGDEATGALLESVGGTILGLGDMAYEVASAEEFANCFDPSWGRHKSRTISVAGNHEYTVSAAPYFAYFGAAAGNPSAPWRSFDLAGWHIVLLDSNCGDVGGCDASSPQGQWLEADLSANSKPCTLAAFHHPRFSSGFVGVDDDVLPFWQALYAHGVDVIVAGHDHAYERFARVNPSGMADPSRGIRSFVSGAGGTGLHGADEAEPNSETRNEVAFGVLRLALQPTSYSWEFVGAGPGVFTDTGSEACVFGAPVVTITSPAGGTTFPAGATVNLAASASDLEEGSVASSLVWSSNRDGELGSGASLATTLSSGGHVITASVTDETGLTGSAKVSLTVSLPPGAACGIGPELIIVLLGLLAGSAGVQRASRATPKRSR
jgi:hypothetical protein